MANKNSYVYGISRKRKTNIRGFYKMEDGSIAVDNISPILINTQGEFDYTIRNIFRLGEEAVFYRFSDRGFIKTKEGKITKFENRIELVRERLSTEEIKKLIEQYGGLTIFKGENGYVIEIWRK